MDPESSWAYRTKWEEETFWTELRQEDIYQNSMKEESFKDRKKVG